MTARNTLMLAYLLATLPAVILYAQPQRCRDGLGPKDPRNPYVICLPELGRMLPTLPCKGTAENFGQQIVPLGDVNGDGLLDWLVGRTRCDTSVFLSYPHYPVELLLFHGLPGGLPMIETGKRIGPTELMSTMLVLAVGDWDDNHHVDIAAYAQVYSEHSEAGRVVIFWADEWGNYSLADTSRLSCDAEGWYGWNSGVSADVDHNGVVDLVLYGWYGYGLTSLTNGKEIPVPRLLIFRGHDRKRWGRDGIAHTADWRWWNPPPMNTLTAVDHDADGLVDIVLANNDRFPAFISVLYGQPQALPDTTHLDSLNLEVIDGRTAILTDLTGDNIPELVSTTSEQYVLRVYVGLRGQRLAKQFGSGNEPPHAGNPQWWGKPWAQIWEPAKISSQWPGPYPQLYTLGDVDLDGIGDLVGYNAPWVTIYRGGNWLDSLIDAMIDIRAVGGQLSTSRPHAVALLGDIDGTGVPTIAVSYNGVLYVKTTKDVPVEGVYRKLPEGTGVAGVKSEVRRVKGEGLEIRAVPNPARGEVRVEWEREVLGGKATITISDANGREIQQFTVEASSGEFLWTTTGVASGTYFITLQNQWHSTTTSVVLR